MEYPKIETLYDRDGKFKVVPGQFRCPEFGLVDQWLVTEKIDGTNVRVILESDGSVKYAGRTDNSQFHPPLLCYLQETLPAAKVAAAFDPGTRAIIFGEGYGAGIQNGGVYRPDPALILFDVFVTGHERTWWLNWPDVVDIACKLGVSHVPVIDERCTLAAAVKCVGIESKIGAKQEGIVCRTDPLLFDQIGNRIMWKLKVKDFAK